MSGKCWGFNLTQTYVSVLDFLEKKAIGNINWHFISMFVLNLTIKKTNKTKIILILYSSSKSVCQEKQVEFLKQQLIWHLRRKFSPQSMGLSYFSWQTVQSWSLSSWTRNIQRITLGQFSMGFLLLGGPRWQSGNTLTSHLWGRGSIPVTASSGKAGSCFPLVSSLQYRTLTNSMYWFPLPFQLPVVIWPVQCWKRCKTPNK